MASRFSDIFNTGARGVLLDVQGESAVCSVQVGVGDVRSITGIFKRLSQRVNNENSFREIREEAVFIIPVDDATGLTHAELATWQNGSWKVTHPAGDTFAVMAVENASDSFATLRLVNLTDIERRHAGTILNRGGL